MAHIAIATCEKQPALTPSDQLLADALARAGAEVAAAPWNGPFAPFASADLTLVRSTWDYFDLADDFAAWIGRAASAGPLVNSAEILRWNMTKAYLFELARAGAPVPPTLQTAPEARAIAAAMDALDLEEAIVKPLIGGTASGLSRIRRHDADGLAKAAARLNGRALVQPFLPEIVSCGETSLIFLGGEFSHAILKRAKAGDIRVQTDHGGTAEPVVAPDWAIDQGRAILRHCPGHPAYARVDVIIDDGAITLMEVELVEPELFFTYCPDGAAQLADLALARL